MLREVGIGVSSVGVYASAPGVMSAFDTPVTGGASISNSMLLLLPSHRGDDLWSTAGLEQGTVAGNSTLAEPRRAVLAIGGGAPGVYEQLGLWLLAGCDTCGDCEALRTALLQLLPMGTLGTDRTGTVARPSLTTCVC